MYSGFQIPDSGFVVRGTWIPDSICWWDKNFELCSRFQAQDTGFHKENFLESGFHKLLV